MTTTTGELDLKHALNVAIAAAKEAGGILKSKLDHAVVREKGANDLVTDADEAAQEAIEQSLLSVFPSHGFLGEEGGKGNQGDASGWQWIVDPLDGTTNFAHGLRNFCVSIALVNNRVPQLGVIYDPMAEELFTAIRGAGAHLDLKAFRTSDCQSLASALIAASFPPKLHRDSPEIQDFIEVLLRCQSIRRMGSAALNLCYVACGRLDGYFGGNLNVWDIAAAALIAEEAGVWLKRRDGSDFDVWGREVVACASPELCEQLLGCMPSKTR